MRRLWFPCSASILGACALVGMGALAIEEKDKAAAASGTFKPVAPLLVVMENVDDLFGGFPDKIKSKELKQLKKDAQFLSELFNVVQFHKAEKDWQKWSAENMDQLQKFAALCDKGDAKALQSSYDSINKTCDACHEKYRDN